MRQIRQAVTEDSLFLELQRWCRSGAGKKHDSIRIMSAFASGPAVEALEPFFDVFLSDGNSIEIIVGIDRNGTSGDAIRRLYELQHAYTKRISCHVFQAPSNIAIFHPKLYFYQTSDTLSAMIGSANLTLGGLGHNFESIFLYRDISRESKDAKQLINSWSMFANPTAPLRSGFLRKLTAEYARELIRRLPKRSPFEQQNTQKGLKAIWKPISTVPLPRSRTIPQKQQRVSTKQIQAFLVIDVLTETRETQMQFPLTLVEQFFGFRKHEVGEIRVSQIRAGHRTQSIERHIVRSGGMRRIEMPQIAGKARPLAAIFVRLKRRQFAVMIVPRRTSAYRILNRLLTDRGQQPKHAVRRYYIGTSHDRLLTSLRPVLGSTALSK